MHIKYEGNVLYTKSEDLNVIKYSRMDQMK